MAVQIFFLGSVKCFQDVLYNSKCRKRKKYGSRNVLMAKHPLTQQDFFLDPLLGVTNKECVKAGA